VIEAVATVVFGAFGIGGERCGRLQVVSPDPEATLLPEHITREAAGAVILAGAGVSADALRKAASLNVAGVIAGSIDNASLREYLGYEIGVPITGQEDTVTTLILTSGFGRLPMDGGLWHMLAGHAGEMVSHTCAATWLSRRLSYLVRAQGSSGAPPSRSLGTTQEVGYVKRLYLAGALILLLAMLVAGCARREPARVLPEESITEEEKSLFSQLSGEIGYLLCPPVAADQESVIRILVSVPGNAARIKVERYQGGRLQLVHDGPGHGSDFLVVEAEAAPAEVTLDGSLLTVLEQSPTSAELEVVTNTPFDQDQLPELVQFLTDSKAGVSAVAIALWGTDAPPEWEIRYASSGRTVRLAGGSPEITRDGHVLYVGDDQYLHRLQPDGIDLLLGPLVGSSLVLDSTERYIAYLHFLGGDAEDARWDVAVFDLQTGQDRTLFEPGPDLSVSIWGWYEDEIILCTSSKSGPYSDTLRLQLLSLDCQLSDWEAMSDLPILDLYSERSFDGRFIAYQALTEPTSVIVIDLVTLNLQRHAGCSEPEWAEDGLTVMSGGQRRTLPVER